MPRLAKPHPGWKPRLTIEVDEEKYFKIRGFLDYGMQKRLFNIVVDDLLAMFDQFGQQFFVAMLQKDISYQQFMEKYMKQLEEKSNDAFTVGHQISPTTDRRP